MSTQARAGADTRVRGQAEDMEPGGGLIEMTLPDKPPAAIPLDRGRSHASAGPDNPRQGTMTEAVRSECKMSNGRFVASNGPAMASIRVVCCAVPNSRD